MICSEACRAVYLRSIRIYGYAALLLLLVVASILIDLLFGRETGDYTGMAALVGTMFSGVFSGNSSAAIAAAVMIYLAVAVFFCIEYLSLVRQARAGGGNEARLRENLAMVMGTIVPAHLRGAPLQSRISYLSRLSLLTRLMTGIAVAVACYYFSLVGGVYNLVAMVPVIVVSFYIAQDQIDLRLAVLRLAD